MVRARAKGMKNLDQPSVKMYLKENFHFQSCDLKKNQIRPFCGNSAYLGNRLELELRAKQTKVWDHPREKNIFAKNQFWCCLLVTIPYKDSAFGCY